MDNLFKPGDILKYRGLSMPDLYLILEHKNEIGYKFINISYFLETNKLSIGIYKFNDRYIKYVPQ